MSIRQISALLCAIILVGLLTGCGFHFRGEMPLAPPLHNLYLQTNDPYGQVTRNLKQSLKLSGVHFAPTPQTANVVLIIISEETSQQLLSVGGTQQTRQYNLTLTVTFELTNPAGKVIVSPQSISETQPATLQANQILAGSNEVNDLYQRMRLAIVYDIMNRLSSRDVSTALMTTL